MTPGRLQREKHYFDRRNRNVQGYFYLNGRRVRHKLCSFGEAGLDERGNPTKDTSRDEKRRARLYDRLYRQVERELLERQEARSAARARISARFDDWLAGVKKTHALKTYMIYKETMGKYKALVGDHDISTFGSTQVNRFHQGLKASGLSDASVKVHLVHLKVFANWAYSDESIARVPKFPKIRPVVALREDMTDEELKRMHDTILEKWAGARNRRHQRTYWLCYRTFLMGVATGMRRSEIAFLPWANIDLEGGEVRVTQQAFYTVKERREKIIPLLPDLTAFLKSERAAAPEETWFLDDGKGERFYRDVGSLTRAFIRLQEACGLRGKDVARPRRVKPLHGFRSLFITTGYNRLGVPLEDLQRWAGHRNIHVTASYVSADEERKRQTARTFAQNPSGIGAVLTRARKGDGEPPIN